MPAGIDSYLPDDRHTQGFVFVVLFLVVLPVVVILSQIAPYVLTTAIGVGFLAWLIAHTGVLSGSDDGEAVEHADPMETLRERYARGDVDEAEFERRLDRLVETEDLDAADATVDRETLRARE